MEFKQMSVGGKDFFVTDLSAGGGLNTLLRQDSLLYQEHKHLNAMSGGEQSQSLEAGRVSTAGKEFLNAAADEMQSISHVDRLEMSTG
jgi:hypothetical protein